MSQSTSLRDLLELEEVEVDLYRAPHVYADPSHLYGGQVAAQALRAAAATVESDRFPHSMHGYYLRPGNSAERTIFEVYRDRDGHSFSARRVVARQDGNVIFNMSSSFHVDEEGPASQVVCAPFVDAPDSCPPIALERAVAVEARDAAPERETEWPMQYWTRCPDDLGSDRVLQACALTYLSDGSTGLAPFADSTHRPLASLDHAVWFHRPARADHWLLNDMVPGAIAQGRGWYTGSIFDQDGRLVASIAQEALFRRRG
ncbi:MAG: acyl-CoA thioesterase [Marmoricola sp.]